MAPFHPPSDFSTNPIGEGLKVAINALSNIADAATTSFVPGGASSRAQGDFLALVQAGSELARSQLGVNPGGKVETISNEGGRLAVEAGLAATLDDGIVLFHKRITADKPGLRKVLRRFDEKAGRLKPRKVTKAMRAVRLALKAGMVLRSPDGKIKGLTRAAQAKVKRVQSRTKAATRKAEIKRQKRFASQLRRLK